MESKLRNIYIKEMIVFVSKNFNDDINHNINILVNKIIPYVNSVEFTIDDAIELLGKCPKLIETISEFRKSDNKFNRESALLNAYYLLTKNDIELSNIDDLISPEFYEQKGSYMVDIDYIKTYYKEIANYPILSKEELRELFIKYSMVDNENKEFIRNKIIVHNLKLVVFVAKKYVGRGVELLDLIQEGNKGLIKAVDKYRYQLGFAFTTYAIWWIKQFIIRYIDEHSRLIAYSVHLSAKINKYDRYKNILNIELGREPTKEELAKELHTTVEKLNEYDKYLMQPIYLDEPINIFDNNDEMTRGDLIKDEKSDMDSIANKILLEELKYDIENDKKLSEREKDIIFSRYGFNNNQPQTLHQLAVKYHLTRERVRQIEVKVIKRLKNKYIRNKKFVEFFDDSPTLKFKNK